MNDRYAEIKTKILHIANAYLNNHLLKMIEMYSACKYNADVWHDGRFLDHWADDKVKEALPKCFAHYDKEDMISALSETYNLFAQLAKETAEISDYPYPETAVNYAGYLPANYLKNNPKIIRTLRAFRSVRITCAPLANHPLPAKHQPRQPQHHNSAQQTQQTD